MFYKFLIMTLYMTLLATVKRVLFAGVNYRDIEITENSWFLIFAVDRISFFYKIIKY